MNQFINLDLLSLGITIAGIGLLSVAIFFNKPKSETNKAFLLFSVVSILWGIANYLNYKFTSPELILWTLRFVIFFGTWQAFSLYNLIYVFPKDEVKYSKKFEFILIPWIIIASLLTLTPLVFSKVSDVAGSGNVSTVSKGPAILIFLITVIFFIVGAFYLLVKKIRNSSGVEKKQLDTIALGLFITFLLIGVFNFLLPALFDYVRLIPYGATFILPFIFFMAYAIYRHKLFNIRDLATVTVALSLTVVTFGEIIFANTLPLIIFRVSVFIIVLVFSIQLIRNMFNLEFANDRLKELDQMKSEFVSLATHQIRSPLTAIKGYISLVEEGDYGPVTPEIAKVMDIMMQSTNNLVTIVGDFLDVSRIEQNRMKYDYTDFDLEKLVSQVTTEYKPNVTKRGLELTYSFDTSKSYMVHADLGKIKQVIGNIIDNSIKYTPKGSVNVTLGSSGDKFLIKIADTGVGIPATTIPKLFQKFTRAENANETNILGTGLGLYVAKQMIEAHHGRVWAESEGPGKGSQFYIELPISHVS